MVYVFLADGFEEVEALCPLDLLRRAGLEVTTVAIRDAAYAATLQHYRDIGTTATNLWSQDNLLVTGAHGITVAADMAEDAFAKCLFGDFAPEAVILPGGMPGTTHLAHDRAVEKALAAAHANGAWIAAICAAPMVLGQQGYLRGRRATCFPGFEKYLDGATEIGGSVIRDGSPARGGGVITARGVGVAMEFGLELVSVLASPEEAGAIRAAIQAP